MLKFGCAATEAAIIIVIIHEFYDDTSLNKTSGPQ